MRSRVRASVICWHNDQLLCVRLEDPTSKEQFITVPGGAVEEDETAPEAAARETFEETGFSVVVDPESCVDKEYIFHWDGEDYDCLTMFYRGRLKSPLQAPVDDAAYHRGVVWVPRAEIREVFGYSREILDAIEELLT